MSDTNTGAPAASSAPAESSTPATDASSEVLETLGTEGDDSGEETSTPAEAKKVEEIKKQLKSFELKVNGKSKKIDVDLNNDEEVTKYLQKAMAADEKFQEASNYKKQAEQLVEMLQNDPLSILRNPALGLDIRKLAEQVLLQDLEEQQKSPEQKKIEDYERRLKEYEDKMKNEEESSKKTKLAEMQRKHEAEIEESIVKALDANDIPAEPFFMRRLADVWASAVESGWEDATLEDIMPYVKQRMDNDFKSLIDKNKDPERLEKLLGKDVLNNYRKSAVAKVKAAPKTASQVTTDAAKASPTKEAAPVKKVKITDIAGW